MLARQRSKAFHSKVLQKEFDQMRNSGIPRLSVPKFLVAGKEPQGRTLEAWSAIIDAELKKSPKK